MPRQGNRTGEPPPGQGLNHGAAWKRCDSTGKYPDASSNKRMRPRPLSSIPCQESGSGNAARGTSRLNLHGAVPPDLYRDSVGKSSGKQVSHQRGPPCSESHIRNPGLAQDAGSCTPWTLVRKLGDASPPLIQVLTAASCNKPVETNRRWPAPGTLPPHRYSRIGEPDRTRRYLRYSVLSHTTHK